VAALVREGKIHQIYTMMQVGQKHGMQTMNQALFQAYGNGAIRLDEALARSANVQELEALLAKADPTYRPRTGSEAQSRQRRAA
jgi:twitching motility protein PilT